MRIGIIGAGNVGGTLGRGWLRYGHQVTFGVREPGSSKALELVRDGAKVALPRRAIVQGMGRGIAFKLLHRGER